MTQGEKGAKKSKSAGTISQKRSWGILGAVLLLLLIVYGVTRFASSEIPEAKEISQPQSFDEVLTLAQKEEKPVMLLLYKKGLGAYETTTLQNEKIAELLPRFTLYKAELLEDPRYINSYEIDISPTWLFLTPQGKEIDRGEGAISPDYLREIMETTLDRPAAYEEIEAAVKTAAENNEAAPVEDLLRLARVHTNRGDTTAAIAYAEEVLAKEDLPETSPLRGEALLVRGSIRYLEGKDRPALEDFSAYLENFPETSRASEALLSSMLAQLNLNRPQQAEESLTTLLDRFPNSEDAAQGIGIYYLQYQAAARRNVEAAVAGLEKIIENRAGTPLAPQARFELARIYSSSPAKSSQALSLLKEIYSDTTVDPQLASNAQDLMIRISMRESNIPYAILELQTLLDKKMPNADVIAYKLADLYRNYQQPERALELLATIPEKYPSSYVADDALNALGMIHLQTTHNYDEGLKHFEEVPKRFPRSDAAPLSKYLSVRALYFAKRYDEALARIDTILATEPAESDLAQELRQVREHIQGSRDYEDKPLSLLVDGKIALQDGNHEEAVKIFDQILEEYPGSHATDDALLSKAQIHLTQAEQARSRKQLTDELSRAEKLLKRVINEYPESFETENAQRLLNQINQYKKQL